MQKFKGFPPGAMRHVKLPELFFRDLLPLIDDLAELRVVLFCFAALPQKEGRYRYLCRRDFTQDEVLMTGLGGDESALDVAIKRTVERGVLLRADVQVDGESEAIYFLNTEIGREAVAAINAGRWRPGDAANPVEVLPPRPNIFTLYENNIGPLTPMIAEELKDAEAEYPSEWIEHAIKQAVEYNKRSWRYIRAILEKRAQEGQNNGLVERSTGTDAEKYISGKYADFIKHKPDSQ